MTKIGLATWRLAQVALLTGSSFMMLRGRSVTHAEACAGCTDAKTCDTTLETGGPGCGINTKDECYVTEGACPSS
jgi:hypothetical protein